MQFTPHQSEERGLTSEAAGVSLLPLVVLFSLSSASVLWHVDRSKGLEGVLCAREVSLSFLSTLWPLGGEAPSPPPLFLSFTHPPTPLLGVTASSPPPHGECLLISCVLHAFPLTLAQPAVALPTFDLHVRGGGWGRGVGHSETRLAAAVMVEILRNPISAACSLSSLLFCREPSTVCSPFVAPSRLHLSGREK